MNTENKLEMWLLATPQYFHVYLWDIQPKHMELYMVMCSTWPTYSKLSFFYHGLVFACGVNATCNKLHK